jgi:hypothetical protein
VTASPLLRRALGSLCIVTVCVVPAACGSDDSPASAPAATSTTATASCSDQLVAFAQRSDVKAAAAAGSDLSDDTQAVFDAFNGRCGDELDAMSDADAAKVIARIDPKVVELLASHATESFQKTGSVISNG